MCYRFAYGDVDRVSSKYKVQLSDEALSRLGDPLNVFPSNYAPVLFTNGSKEIYSADTMKWGLIPFWAEDEKIGRNLFNARIETASRKPSFKYSFEHHRCIIPVCAFYENWKEGDKKKIFTFRESDNEIFSMAGLFSEWKKIKTFTVLTMPAGPLVKLVHDRMPLVMNEKQEKLWLLSGNDPKVVSSLIDFSNSFKLITDEKS